MARVPPCFPRRCFSISQTIEARRPAPLRPPLLQRSRTRQSSGLLRQRIQVVLQVQYLLLSVETAFVSGHALSLVPDLYIRRVHLGLHFHPHRNGNRIEVGRNFSPPVPVKMRKITRPKIKPSPAGATRCSRSSV